MIMMVVVVVMMMMMVIVAIMMMTGMMIAVCSVLPRNFGRDHIFLQVMEITDLSQCSPQDFLE